MRNIPFFDAKESVRHDHDDRSWRPYHLLDGGSQFNDLTRSDPTRTQVSRHGVHTIKDEMYQQSSMSPKPVQKDHQVQCGCKCEQRRIKDTHAWRWRTRRTKYRRSENFCRFMQLFSRQMVKTSSVPINSFLWLSSRKFFATLSRVILFFFPCFVANRPSLLPTPNNHSTVDISFPDN